MMLSMLGSVGAAVSLPFLLSLLPALASASSGLKPTASNTGKSTFSIPTASTANPSASAPTVNNGKAHIAYSTVGGYFLQDLTSTDPTTFDYTTVNFGLINQSYSKNEKSAAGLTQWQRFNRLVHKMNREAPKNVVYKLLFIGRHGEGYHNAAESFYGTPAWNCYYAQLDGNSTATWADAHLTPNGKQQANIAHDFWKHEFEVEKIEAPQSYYVSPLSRCLQTARRTYAKLPLPKKYPFAPTVKEFFREGISIHTCDRRSSRTYIHKKFPKYKIDPILSEEDELWNGITAESSTGQQYRSKLVLDEVFAKDPSTIISITTHSGEARALLAVLGHIPFSLVTGEIIPMLIKAETIKGMPAPTTTTAWSPSSWCTNGAPVTSQTTSPYQCVCSDGVEPLATLPSTHRVPAKATQGV